MFEPDKKYEEGKSLGHAYNISQLLAWDFKTDKEAPQKYTGTISDVKSEKIDMRIHQKIRRCSAVSLIRGRN